MLSWLFNTTIGRWVGLGAIALLAGLYILGMSLHRAAVTEHDSALVANTTKSIDDQNKAQIDGLRQQLAVQRQQAYEDQVRIAALTAAAQAARAAGADVVIKEVTRVSPKLVEECILGQSVADLFNCVRAGRPDCGDPGAKGSGR